MNYKICQVFLSAQISGRMPPPKKPSWLPVLQGGGQLTGPQKKQSWYILPWEGMALSYGNDKDFQLLWLCFFCLSFLFVWLGKFDSTRL